MARKKLTIFLKVMYVKSGKVCDIDCYKEKKKKQEQTFNVPNEQVFGTLFDQSSPVDGPQVISWKCDDFRFAGDMPDSGFNSDFDNPFIVF